MPPKRLGGFFPAHPGSLETDISAPPGADPALRIEIRSAAEKEREEGDDEISDVQNLLHLPFFSFELVGSLVRSDRTRSSITFYG